MYSNASQAKKKNSHSLVLQLQMYVIEIQRA